MRKLYIFLLIGILLAGLTFAGIESMTNKIAVNKATIDYLPKGYTYEVTDLTPFGNILIGKLAIYDEAIENGGKIIHTETIIVSQNKNATKVIQERNKQVARALENYVRQDKSKSNPIEKVAGEQLTISEKAVDIKPNPKGT